MNLGFDVQQSATNVRRDAYWFGESQSRVVISCTLKNAEAVLSLLRELNTPYEYLGIVTDRNIDIEGEYWGHIDEWKKLYDTAIERMLVSSINQNGIPLSTDMSGNITSERVQAIEKGNTEKGEVKGV